VGIGLAVLLVVFGVAVSIGARRQQSALGAQIDRLIQIGATLDPERRPSTHDLDNVPAPVARYLRRALPEPKCIQQVRMRQIGTLRTNVTSEKWMPFEAEHIVVPPAIAFVWNARVSVAPLVHVRVRVEFADTGEVSGIYTPGRWGTFPDGYRQVPWEGHLRDYREGDHVVVPTEGDVGQRMACGLEGPRRRVRATNRWLEVLNQYDGAGRAPGLSAECLVTCAVSDRGP